MMPSGTQKLTWGLFVSVMPLFWGGLGILLPVLYVYHGLSVGFWVGGCLSAFLLLIAIFDFQYGLIFDRLLAPMLLIGSGFRFTFPLWEWPQPGMGLLFGAGILFLLRFLSHGGIGMGDVKMGGVLGVWLGAEGVFLTLMLAFLLGGLCAAWLLCRRSHTWRDQIPFGPFLSLSAWLVYLYGKTFLTVYGELWL
jgi:prepilin signal peptidase PulO-like enzyme (type II secretory pathway)